jgi:hypothetical protein
MVQLWKAEIEYPSSGAAWGPEWSFPNPTIQISPEVAVELHVGSCVLPGQRDQMSGHSQCPPAFFRSASVMHDRGGCLTILT